jgi:hypothetical protein
MPLQSGPIRSETRRGCDCGRWCSAQPCTARLRIPGCRSECSHGNGGPRSAWPAAQCTRLMHTASGAGRRGWSWRWVPPSQTLAPHCRRVWVCKDGPTWLWAAAPGTRPQCSYEWPCKHGWPARGKARLRTPRLAGIDGTASRRCPGHHRRPSTSGQRQVRAPTTEVAAASRTNLLQKRLAGRTRRAVGAHGVGGSSARPEGKRGSTADCAACGPAPARKC